MPNLNSIQTIKQYFHNHNGLQLTNRFTVQFFNLPGNIATNTAEYQAEYMALGPRAINTVQDNLTGFGGGRFVPRSQTFLGGGFGVQLIFPITNDNHLLQLFDKWFNMFYRGYNVPAPGSNSAPTFSINYYNTTVRNCSMTVNMLDPNGGINNTTTFYEVFPVETQPIEFSMATVDKYLRYAVTFAYRDRNQQFF